VVCCTNFLVDVVSRVATDDVGEAYPTSLRIRQRCVMIAARTLSKKRRFRYCVWGLARFSLVRPSAPTAAYRVFGPAIRTVVMTIVRPGCFPRHSHEAARTSSAFFVEDNR